MGIQKKHGKGRLDRWYKLAKEKGYRARAAFKLIQLNRKYGFLEKSKVLLDLCAAPGSWCQVAAETMPAESLIVGVDLSPIKPIPRTTTFQGDIASDKCRATIRQHIKNWKVDTVLHDGAPNVGTAWVQDAFSQAELVLQALKLSIEFLREGGIFITKVFRSKDYNALLWVFNQLFHKVDATKPPASRNVSAEIFVVCRGFKAPNRIDPKLLDPRSVFAELQGPAPNNEAKVFNPEQKKRKREGYEEGHYTQFKEAPASHFIETTDPIAMLGELNKLSFQSLPNGDIALAVLSKLPETTNEIRQCCSDLKVLGRKEFRILLKWRLKAREILGLSKRKITPQDHGDDEVAEVESMDEELRNQEDLERLHDNEVSKKRKEKRRLNAKKQKEIFRMQMHMIHPKDIGLEQSGPHGEDSMFSLSSMGKAHADTNVPEVPMSQPFQDSNGSSNESETEIETDEEEDKLDEELDALYNRYQERIAAASAENRARRARAEEGSGDSNGFSEEQKSQSEDDFDGTNHLPVIGTEGLGPHVSIHTNSKRQEKHAELTKRASTFFDNIVFKDIDGLAEEGDHESKAVIDKDLLHKPSAGQSSEEDPAVELSRKSIVFKNGAAERLSLSAGTNENRASDPASSRDVEHRTSSKDDDDVYSNTGNAKRELRTNTRDEDGSGRLDIDIITAEAMTLAQQVATGARSAHDLVDQSFNKYAFLDRDGLPDWFLDDESKHNRPAQPITAAGARAIKEKLRALNARPIKKVREAKDRKRYKTAQRLEKLRKRSALIAEEDGPSEKDKARSIARLMSRAKRKRTKQQVKLVVAKGGNRGISGRPRGVKGKYKIVDARLKKDTRAAKRLAKK